MKVETISKAIIAALLAAELASCTKAALMQNRITDLETQRDIYKSMYEDWKGAAGEVAGYADTLRDSLKARDRLDGKLLVEDAGDFLCTAYCTEKREHICGTGTGITASGAPVEADVTVAADPGCVPVWNHPLYRGHRSADRSGQGGRNPGKAPGCGGFRQS